MNIRGYLNTKRLGIIQVSKTIRDRIWFLDYIKAGLKPVQTLNYNTITEQLDWAEYVDYNGQTLSLEYFLNDKFDSSTRGFYIEDGNLEDKITSFYGYSTSGFEGDWIKEYDPNPSSFGGYSTSGFEGDWFLESSNGQSELIFGGYSTSGIEGDWTVEELQDLRTNDFIVYMKTWLFNNYDEADFQTLRNNLDRYVISTKNYDIKNY